MKTQMMLDRDSAMSKRQKYCIQANELTRRLMNIDEDEEKSNESTLVHAYAVAGGDLKDHIKYLHYLMTNFINLS